MFHSGIEKAKQEVKAEKKMQETKILSNSTKKIENRKSCDEMSGKGVEEESSTRRKTM